MKRFFILCLLLFPMLAVPARAQTIRWVDFRVPYESLRYALDQDIRTGTASFLDRCVGPGCLPDRRKLRIVLSEKGGCRFENRKVP